MTLSKNEQNRQEHVILAQVHEATRCSLLALRGRTITFSDQFLRRIRTPRAAVRVSSSGSSHYLPQASWAQIFRPVVVS